MENIVTEFEQSVETRDCIIFKNEDRVAVVDFASGFVKIGYPHAVYTGMYDPMVNIDEVERQAERSLFGEERDDFQLWNPSTYNPQLGEDCITVDLVRERGSEFTGVKVRLDEFEQFEFDMSKEEFEEQYLED